MVTAAAGTLLAMLSFTAPLVTIQQTATGLGAGASGQTWMLSSMSLGLTVAMLTAGTAGDDFGRRRVFVGGAALLTIASVASALAPTTLVFVLARVFAGFGAAAVLACSLALIGHALPPGHARVRAMGLWGASMGAGLAIGPFVASLCAMGSNWRLTYWIGAVLTAALAVGGRTVLAESTSGRSRRVDVPGVVLLAAGLASLLAGLTEGRGGWDEPLVLVLLVVGIVVLVAFLVVEWRSRAPMIDLSLFRRRALLSATAVSFANGVGITAAMSFLPTVLQRGLGESSLVASGFLLVWSVTSVAASMSARLLGARVPPGARMAGGLILTALGLLALMGLANRVELVAGLFLAGIGTGLVNATVGGEAVASVPAHRAGMGSGINNTSRYLGAALGVTVVFVLSVHSGQANLLSGWGVSAVVCAVVSLAGAVAALGLRAKEPVAASLPRAGAR
ncbi:MFS transporter [Amycolatopsis acidiphila]|nr:MFS transporter [Amycolatopsis acidiphila]